VAGKARSPTCGLFRNRNKSQNRHGFARIVSRRRVFVAVFLSDSGFGNHLPATQIRNPGGRLIKAARWRVTTVAVSDSSPLCTGRNPGRTGNPLDGGVPGGSQHLRHADAGPRLAMGARTFTRPPEHDPGDVFDCPHQTALRPDRRICSPRPPTRQAWSPGVKEEAFCRLAPCHHRLGGSRRLECGARPGKSNRRPAAHAADFSGQEHTSFRPVIRFRTQVPPDSGLTGRPPEGNIHTF
jgi:hypothetical protein